MYPRQILRYISGDYSPEDEKYVRRWLAEDPSREQLLEELQETWKLSGTLDLGDEEEAWNSLRNRIYRSKEKETANSRMRDLSRRYANRDYKGVNMFLKVAAILLIVTGVSIYLYTLSSYYNTEPADKKVVYQTVTADRGEQVRFSFKDGTKVILNAASTIRYSEHYGDSTRELYLDGEAYFKVNHDHPLPFIVYAKSAKVVDIGTEFNVRAYPEQKGASITVAEGKVLISTQIEPDNSNNYSGPDSSSVVLSKNQEVFVGEDSDELTVREADLQKTLGWLNNRFIFDGEPLSNIIKRLERQFKIEVKVEDTSLLNQKITATFIDESVENIAILLSESMNVEYSIEQDTVRFFTTKKTIKGETQKAKTSQQ